jgi:MFS transporter, DHA2 family, multidrug resistance protein
MSEQKSFFTTELLIATIALALGSFMNILDTTIVNTAVSHIAGDFAIPYNQGTWTITSYAVSEAIMLPLTGWLTSRFGILKQYVWATLLFMCASVLCGIAPNFEFLLFARVLQGVVGASMIPLSQTLLMSIYPSDKRGLAIGIWAMTAVAAPVVGPIAGGWITDNLTWRWAFYINVPIGLFSAYMTYNIFQRRGWVDVIKKIPIDRFGVLCLAVGVGALQIMLDKGNDLDWFNSNVIVILTLISIVFLVMLVIWELHQKNPVVNLRFFANRNFAVGVILICLGSTAFFSTVVVLPIWLQNYMGYTAFQSGLTTATTSLFVVFLAPIIGGNIHKVDARKVVAFGFLVFFLVSLAGSTMPPDITQGHIAFVRLFLGIGLACFFIPLNNIMMADIGNHDLAAASGLSSFTRNIGNSFGTSLVVSYWDHVQAHHHQDIVASIQTGNSNLTPYLNQLQGGMTAKLAQINQLIDSQAALMGINDIMLLSGLIMLFLIPVVFIAHRSNKVVEGGGH